MKVNYNMSAVVTNKQLLSTESKLTGAMERLSSGLKINHAKDDAAGMAISNKMQLQIDGLDQASRNASDGNSVLQTADGSLNEVTSILQRMRELSVQAATDTNSLDERTAIQEEMNSLREEVDRVSQNTEFNTKPLLDGTLDVRVYAKNVSRISTSVNVEPGDYTLDVTQQAEKGTMTAGNAMFADMTATIGAAGAININGSAVEISATDTYEQVYEKIRDAAEIGNTSAEIDADGALSLTTLKYGSSQQIEITFTNAALAAAVGFDSETPAVVKGTDAEIDLKTGFADSATTDIDGNRVVITDKSGFEMAFLIDEGYPAAGTTGTVDFEVTEMGAMTLQIGANRYQTMDVRIPKLDSDTLYLDTIDVTKVKGGDNAIIELDKALDKVTSARAAIGAYQNRLDYAVGSLDETSENMTAALSRIQDADMAEEMSNYTQQNVLQQAAISVLSQANDMPQQTLQLLQ